MMYQDIDLSFRTNSKNDVSVLEDANAIKASLYNRLLINNSEMFFVDGKKETVTDYLFEENDFLTRDSIKELIKNAIESDDRIAGIDFLGVTFQDDEARYLINVTFTMKTNTVRANDNKPVNIKLFLNKQ